eukprot:scaffold82803_cov17-Tisochrysis_lutea.AAC.2
MAYLFMQAKMAMAMYAKHSSLRVLPFLSTSVVQMPDRSLLMPYSRSNCLTCELSLACEHATDASMTACLPIDEY